MNFDDLLALSPMDPHQSRSLRVLVVDDDDINRDLLCLLLMHRGHEVGEAACGRTAVEQAATGHFDLVLMDIEMPGVDGLQATRCIRSLGGDVARMPVWIVSSHAFSTDVAAAHAAGANGHLSKPLDFKALWRVLERVECRPGTGSQPGACLQAVHSSNSGAALRSQQHRNHPGRL